MTVVNFRRDMRIDENDRRILREFCKSLGGDPVVLANKLGLKVFEVNLPHAEDGYIEFDADCGSKSGYKIVLNANMPVARKKFTVAHEIGHYVLHRNTTVFQERKQHGAEIFDFPSGHRSTDSWHSEYLPSWMEGEANSFAACVLLPPNALKEANEYIKGEPIALASRLALSPSFVTRRFEEVYFGMN